MQIQEKKHDFKLGRKQMANNEEEEFEFRARAEKEAQQKPSMVGRVAGAYANFMGKEGAYGANPAGKAFSMVKKPFEKAGEFAAEQLGKRQVNPYVSAGIGTAMQMIPDIALTAGPQGPGADVQPKPPEGLFRQMESASGGMKGSLSEQFKTPSLMFSKGTGAAKPLYQQATKSLPYEQTIFNGLTKPQEIVDKAVEMIEKGGKLEPQEGFIARKSLDQIKKKLNPDAFDFYRKKLDQIAKSSEDIAAADPMHRRGMMAESLRQIMPQNKYGGASAFKMGIIPALAGIGGSVAGPVGTAIGAGIGTAAMMPVVQALAAGGLGLGAKISPRLIPAILQYLRSKQQNENPNP